MVSLCIKILEKQTIGSVNDVCMQKRSVAFEVFYIFEYILDLEWYKTKIFLKVKGVRQPLSILRLSFSYLADFYVK